ncbi:MAG TPA: glutamate racemase [Oscillospiraceae bacterium]|nr:glutamate racemase [Oscillospiraceae bacterium]
MNNDAIGVFDSGIGGLTTVKELNALLPNENIIYFGDTARVPYGTRSKETILKYTAQDVNFLKQHKVKMIIAACGTVSSVINPTAFKTDIPFTGVLLPAVQAACGATRTGRIGVIGTTATIKSGSYGKAIRAIRPDTFVVGNPCQLLVSLAENGFSGKNNKVSQLVLEQYLAPIIAEKVDTLILGCTHFPIFKEQIQEMVGSSVTLISPGEEAAKYTNVFLASNELLSDRTEKGRNEFYVSDSVELFEDNAKTLLGHTVEGEVKKADIEQLIG